MQFEKQQDTPTIKPEKKALSPYDYSDDEKDYFSYLRRKLEDAQTERDAQHDEFDGMSYLQYWESNEKAANSYIKPRSNKYESNFVTGTTRQALLALTARVNSLNLRGDVKAFDKHNNHLVDLGQAMEDVIFIADRNDDDDVKKLLRHYEMYKQGTVFVSEDWTQEFVTQKKLNKSKWKGQIKDVDWTERLEMVFEGPRREIIPGPQMYLGSMKVYDMTMQPYLFRVRIRDYDQAKAVYGGWERWTYVPRDLKLEASDKSQPHKYWSLTEVQENKVEEIIYQDKWNNEFMVILNGVMMMPIGFPMPWGYGEYNTVKQVFEPISSIFPYGVSVPKKTKMAQAAENEMWRLMLLKTQKSFDPPRFNLTGRILSRGVFMPGAVTHGIDPSLIKTTDEDSAPVNQSEVNVLGMIRSNLNENTVPEVTRGQSPEGDPTATEVLQIQREARVILGLAIFSAAMLEEKLTQLRVFNVLENWFKPVGTKLDEARQAIKDRFRTTSRSVPIEGQGLGRRIVEPFDPNQVGTPTSEDVYMLEEQLSKQERQPVRKIFVNAKELAQAKITWYVEVHPKEKESSDLSKVLFDGFMDRALKFPNVNLGFLEEEFAKVWDVPSDKLFTQQSQSALGMDPEQQQKGSQTAAGAVSKQLQDGIAGKPQIPSINTLNE